MFEVSSVLGKYIGAAIVGSVMQIGNSGGGMNFIAGLKEILNAPMVNYVPIFTPMQKCNRKSVVSTSMVMSQIDGRKKFVTDNTAPQPRTWHVTGYLRSLLPNLESGLIAYPTILLQKAILDWSMTNGETVLFKTKDGEFVDALISDMSIEDDNTMENSARIVMTIQELVDLTAVYGSLEELSNVSSAKLSSPAIYQAGVLGAAIVTAKVVGALQ